MLLSTKEKGNVMTKSMRHILNIEVTEMPNKRMQSDRQTATRFVDR